MTLLVTSAAGANGAGYGKILAFADDGKLNGIFGNDSRIGEGISQGRTKIFRLRSTDACVMLLPLVHSCAYREASRGRSAADHYLSVDRSLVEIPLGLILSSVPLLSGRHVVQTRLRGRPVK
jgi:hypothetical protein